MKQNMIGGFRVAATVLTLWGVMLQADPTHLAAGELQRSLVIVEKGTDSLGFYTEAGEHLHSVPVGRFPHEMVLSADRKRAYVTDNGSLRFVDEAVGGNTVTIIDLVRREVLGKIELEGWRRPHAIDLDPSTNRLIVGVENPDQLLLIDAHDRIITEHYDVCGRTPHMAAFSPRGDIAYVSNAQSANVSVIDLKSGETETIAVGKKPQSAVLSRDEKTLFVACDDYLSVVDLAQRREVARIGQGCNRLKMTADGSLLVYASNAHGVGFVDPATHRLLHHLDLPNKPYSLNLSSDEEVAYIAAEMQDTVYIVDLAARRVRHQFQTAPGTRPDPVMDYPASQE